MFTQLCFWNVATSSCAHTHAYHIVTNRGEAKETPQIIIGRITLHYAIILQTGGWFCASAPPPLARQSQDTTLSFPPHGSGFGSLCYPFVVVLGVIMMPPLWAATIIVYMDHLAFF